MKTRTAAIIVTVLAPVLLMAQSVRLGDVSIRDVIVVTNEQDAAAIALLNASNATASAAIASEALLRIEGDAAGTNYAAGLVAALPSHAAVTGIASAVAGPLLGAHINRTDNPHAVTAAQAGALPLAGGTMDNGATVTMPNGGAAVTLSAAGVNVSVGDTTFANIGPGAYELTAGGAYTGLGIGVVHHRADTIMRDWSFPADEDDTELDFASRSWTAEQIAAMPLVPTNAVDGWLMYDYGSNMWLRVSVSNWSFTVWEVVE